MSVQNGYSFANLLTSAALGGVGSFIVQKISSMLTSRKLEKHNAYQCLVKTVDIKNRIDYVRSMSMQWISKFSVLKEIEEKQLSLPIVICIALEDMLNEGKEEKNIDKISLIIQFFYKSLKNHLEIEPDMISRLSQKIMFYYQGYVRAAKALDIFIEYLFDSINNNKKILAEMLYGGWITIKKYSEALDNLYSQLIIEINLSKKELNLILNNRNYNSLNDLIPKPSDQAEFAKVREDFQNEKNKSKNSTNV